MRKEKQKEKEAMLFINNIPYFMLERNLNKMLLVELWLGTLEIDRIIKEERPKWKDYVV